MSLTFAIFLFMKNLIIIFFLTFWCFQVDVFSAEAGTHFQLQWQKDAPLTIGATGFWMIAQYRYHGMEPAQPREFSEDDLLPWDRPFAGTYNPGAASASDALSFVALLPLGLDAWEFSQNRISGKEWGGHSLMLLQAVGMNSALNLTVRSLRIWPRPFIYGYEGSPEERASGQASGSFYSGHASNAFTVATFTTYTWWINHPAERSRYAIAALSYSAATSIAVLRVAAGKHFPSDVIVGAAMGSFFGWLVPWLHKQERVPRNLPAGERLEQGNSVANAVKPVSGAPALAGASSGPGWLLTPWSAGERPGVMFLGFF